jgi:hypothetical protein
MGVKKDIEWIKNLKVGDEVIISRWYYSGRNLFKTTVNKITATGRIKTSDGSEYTAEGRKYGQTEGDLLQVTSELLDEIERKELLYKIDFEKFKKKLSSDRLKIILQWQEELAQPKE